MVVARIPFAQAALVVLLASAGPSAAQTSIMPMFILDSTPLSLDASIVAVHPKPTYTYHSIVTYSVDCPKSASPDNDACRAQSIYPAEVWHTDGSMWGGTTTARADDSTTDWVCNLASGALRSPTSGPFCVKNITAAGGATRVETTYLDKCYAMAHTVPLLVTAGADKLPSYYYDFYSTYDVSELHSLFNYQLSSIGCTVSSTTAVTSTASTTTTNGGAAVTGGTVPTTGATATQGQVSDTAAGSSSPSPTATGESSGTGTFGEMSWLMAVGAVVMSLII
ncbi:hypothetical protein VF21_04847 [Pseudogymnoascus sp. 05NY08]|nr:hypothetical protein VF21_04847 [Pseudogymnoascus sp. 05NY08]